MLITSPVISPCQLPVHAICHFYHPEFLLVPAALISLVLNHSFDVMEILWTFSIYLESVAILPQLFMISKTGEAESITSHYLFALGAYRALYIFNWAYRWVA